MLFNSFIFILFIAVFFAVWISVKRNNNPKWILLTISSFVFYAWWDWRFLFLILFSGLVDFGAGLMIVKSDKQRKFWLVFSLLINVGALSIFKYSTFFASLLDGLFGKIGIASNLVSHIPEFALILPVGISFYTFQSMSYTIDIYKRKLEPTKNIFHFFAYLSMFPQLVAGPIIRAKDLLVQLTKTRTVGSLEIWHGLKLMALGFFQKTVLADNIGVMVNNAYHDTEAYQGGAFWWVITIGFALQIYFDFSGYSLIARGLAKWMGLHFKMNFNHPYLSTSLRSFWTRWHISLSTWFRDYVYIPLGGNQKGLMKSIFFMWITMLISGLWHGAAITFIVWGGIHALFLSVERIAGSSYKKLPLPVRYLFTMFQVLIAWVFFRAESMNQASAVVINLFDFDHFDLYLAEFKNAYVFLILALGMELGYFLSIKLSSIRKFLASPYIEATQVAFFVSSCLYLRGPEQAFIYFQF